MRLRALVVAFIMWPAACTAGGDDAPADLPPGWEGAARIPHLVQSPCAGSPYEGVKEAARFSIVGREVHVDYDPAHFRCEQDVEAYLKTEAATVEVLVQPVDMEPASVARCDCLYSVEVEFEVAAGQHVVTLYRRWDHQSGADDPVKIGSGAIDSP